MFPHDHIYRAYGDLYHTGENCIINTKVTELAGEIFIQQKLAAVWYNLVKT